MLYIYLCLYDPKDSILPTKKQCTGMSQLNYLGKIKNATTILNITSSAAEQGSAISVVFLLVRKKQRLQVNLKKLF
jgi:hypothetical protein